MSAHEILLLNPRRKGRKKATKKRRTTKKRSTTRKTTTRKNPRRQTRRRMITKGTRTMAKRKTTRKRRAPRRNPSRRRRSTTTRRNPIAGLNYRSAMKNIPLGVIGMFVAKWAAKRGTPDALESDPTTWNGMTYIKGAIGATAGGYVANMIRPGSGQKVLEGGLMLLAYKAAQNHLIPKNSFLTSQLGYYGGLGGEVQYGPGDVETNSAGEPFILGDDGQTWVPLAAADDEDTWEMMGQDSLEVPGRLGFGDVLEVPGRLGMGQPATQSSYARALFDK